MSLVLRAFPSGVVALYTETAGGGDPLDINSPCNAPAKTPNSYLDKIKFHSSLDNMEVVSDTTVTISHPGVGGAGSGDISGGGGGVAGGGSTGNMSNICRFGTSTNAYTLVTHSLGIIPDCMVVVGSQVLIPGMPVQFPGQPTGRYVSAYATTSIIGLYEWNSVSGAGLSAINLDYRVLVFHAPRTPSGQKLMDYNPADGTLKMGFDRFSSDRKYLQVVPGGSPFRLAYGKVIDVKNGAPRFVQPDGTTYDPVPSSQAGRWIVGYGGGTYTGAFGGSMAYNGSLVAPTSIMVQAP